MRESGRKIVRTQIRSVTDTTHEVRMRGFSQKGNRMRFVHPCLRAMEHKVSGKDYRRVDFFQESPRTKMG